MSKEKILVNNFFCISLTNLLRRCVQPSVDVYIAKNSGRLHLTSRVDLECLSFQILNLPNNHTFRWFGNRKHYFCSRIEFVQHKGYQFDYILFDLA